MPKGLAPVAAHLWSEEPGNLIFVYLLQNGVFHRLCDRASTTGSSLEIKKELINIFAHLFTNTRLPLTWDPNDETSYPHDSEAAVCGS